ncbi:MAG: hypothetical protein ACREFI_01330, partial [Stellaceae bacterium]
TDDCVVVAAGRHLAPLVPSAEGSPVHSWDDTSVNLQPELAGTLMDVLTGREMMPSEGAITARELFSILPAAVLVEKRASA